MVGHFCVRALLLAAALLLPLAECVTDPYKALDVPREASDDDIRVAYRKLSLKYNPDKVRSRRRRRSQAQARPM